MDGSGKLGENPWSQEQPNSTADSQKTCTPQADGAEGKALPPVFEKADIGITIADRQGKFLDVNPAMARILGYSPAEMRQMDLGKSPIPMIARDA